jgi:hypothetical protein
MAQITSSNQPIEIDVAGGTAYKTLVCVSSGTVDGTVEVTTEQTDCGVLTSVGDPSYNITAEALCETAPTVDQVSYEDLLTAFVNKTTVAVRVQNPVVSGSSLGAAYYHAFAAKITALSLNKSSSAAYISFSVTFQSDGAIDIVS